jgi:glycosyltransferase involved in cell wall biosynthesis
LRFATLVLTSRYDLIHFHWGGPALRRIGKTIGGAKIVFHLHSPIEESVSARPPKIDTRNSDAVIAVSRAVAARSSHQRTSVIYPGIEIPADTTRDEDPNLIGCALRLTPIKGVSHLLQAIALLKNDFPRLRLQIAGDGPSLPALEAESARFGVADSVDFLGWVHPLPDIRSKWALMVQPSLEDGLPLSVVEAMSEGLPVIGTTVGGLPEIIADGETGLLVPPADPPALASAIATLLRDTELRKRFGAASVARARKCFTAQRMADETAALYRELLSE